MCIKLWCVKLQITQKCLKCGFTKGYLPYFKKYLKSLWKNLNSTIHILKLMEIPFKWDSLKVAKLQKMGAKSNHETQNFDFFINQFKTLTIKLRFFKVSSLFKRFSIFFNYGFYFCLIISIFDVSLHLNRFEKYQDLYTCLMWI